MILPALGSGCIQTMPNIYATVDDIEGELKELYPSGFDNTTDPTDTEVTAKIAEVTTGLHVRVVRALGAEPELGSDAAALVKRGVVAKVVAWLLRKKLVGYAAADILAQSGPYEKDYSDVLKEIEMVPDIFRTETVVTHHVGQTVEANRRAPILADDAIGRTDTF